MSFISMKNLYCLLLDFRPCERSICNITNSLWCQNTPRSLLLYHNPLEDVSMNSTKTILVTYRRNAHGLPKNGFDHGPKIPFVGNQQRQCQMRKSGCTKGGEVWNNRNVRRLRRRRISRVGNLLNTGCIHWNVHLAENMCAGNGGMNGSAEGDWGQKRFYQNETKGTNLRHEIKGNLFEPNEYWYVVYFRNVRVRVVQNTRANIRKRLYCALGDCCKYVYDRL